MIYGIGLSKTGTVSLSGALKILGYKTLHFPQDMIDFNTRNEISINLDGTYDAYLDLPIAHFYKQLDPNGKFILTVRDMDDWLKSCKKFFYPGRFIGDDPILARLQEDVYGSADFDEEKYRAAYIKHEKEVTNHFKGNMNNLLVMNICEGDGWEKLCPFIEQPIPTRMKFPHLNKLPKC